MDTKGWAAHGPGSPHGSARSVYVHVNRSLPCSLHLVPCTEHISNKHYGPRDALLAAPRP